MKIILDLGLWLCFAYCLHVLDDLFMEYIEASNMLKEEIKRRKV